MSKDEMRETTIVITVVVQKMESRPDKTVKSLTPVKRYMRVEKKERFYYSGRFFTTDSVQEHNRKL